VNVLPALPIVVPLATAGLLVLLGTRPTVQRWIGVVGATLSMGIALWLLGTVWTDGIQVLNVGSWQAPYGIALVADLFSVLMVNVAAFVGLAVAVYSLGDVGAREVRLGFHPLYQILLAGVCGAFLTGDLFNLFVWFEVMLMASFALLALGGDKPQLQGGLKYLTLNFISSGLFLTALGILYGKTGTLNMADLAQRIPDIGSGAAFSSIMLLLAAFGIKAGLFPMFFWLPASYHTPSATVSAVFAGLLTKVGVYSMVRVLTLLDVSRIPGFLEILVAISALTMLTGVLGAAAQYEFRKVLSFHIISQIGYMTLGLALFTEAALAATVFYVIHHIVVKTNLFLIAGATQHARGTGDLKALGGMYRDYPWLAFLFMIPAMSLAGIPPLSGFFAKFTLIAAGLDVAAYLAILAALVAGLLTLFSMTKIWGEAFWKKAPDEEVLTKKSIPWSMWLPIGTMAAITVGIGLRPDVLFDTARRVAQELLERESYIRAVLGGPA
jgi:multicomponent Na+:H+ antiporter subunit D